MPIIFPHTRVLRYKGDPMADSPNSRDSHTSMKSRLKARAALVEEHLTLCAASPAAPQGLREAMRYSLDAGGKRIRPVLCLSVAELFGAAAEEVAPFACAIECIHTYSLIHDDLPAMDDDDLRRGKPSNHKAFGEATAILSGDALLADAFLAMTELPTIPAGRIVAAIAEVARAAGSQGMAGGQFLDMLYTNARGISLKELAGMHAMKTGALLAAPCVAGALLAGAGPAEVERVRQFGRELGVAFQIADDILDETGTEQELGKPVGSDAAKNKTTYPSLVGIEESRRMAREKAAGAQAALTPFDGPEAEFLRELANYVVERVS